MVSRGFLTLCVALIAFSSILAFLWLIGFSTEALSILLFVLGIVFILFFGFFLKMVLIQRMDVRVSRASPSELQREDDVLLQAVAFSQSLLLFLVNLTFKDDQIRFFLSGSIAVFAVAFYVLRAWGKIKENSKYRYYSMYVLAIVCGNTVYAIGASVIGQFMLLTTMPFFPHLLLLFTLFSVIAKSLRDLIKEVFKKRYGYDQTNN